MQRSVENLGPNPLLLDADKIVCGENQIPASLYFLLSNNALETTKLATGRVSVAAGAALEIAGKSLMTFGLSANAPESVFVVGTGLNIVGGWIAAHNKNENGSLWNLLLNSTLSRLGPHRSAVETALNKAGITKQEIESLDNLPNDIYTSELNASNIDRWKNAAVPIGSGTAMVAYGDPVVGLVVSGLGLASFPIGGHFYKESNLVRAAKSRAGKSARLNHYVKDVQKEHVQMTDKLNLLQYTPQALFAIKFLAGGGNILPALFGLREGLMGLSNVLSAQRTRESTKRTAEIATHLILAIATEPFIATPQRWKDHVEKSGVTELCPVPFENGIVLRDFSAINASGNATSLAPINLEVSSGSAVILKADSGSGKTVALMGLMHLYENQGSVHIIKDGIATDVHELSGPDEIANRILYITNEGVGKNDRIADLVSQYFLEEHHELHLEHLGEYNPTEVELAWKIADNLLESEIAKLEKQEIGVFPESMLGTLIEIRLKRNEWIKTNLSLMGGNIAKKDIDGQRTFGSLSAGEKERLLVFIASLAAKSSHRTAIILDEPMAHLDNRNREYQLAVLARIQEMENSPALIIVAHDDADVLKKGLKNCQMRDLELKIEKIEETV